MSPIRKSTILGFYLVPRHRTFDRLIVGGMRAVEVVTRNQNPDEAGQSGLVWGEPASVRKETALHPAIAFSSRPQGQKRWTLDLLVATMVR